MAIAAYFDRVNPDLLALIPPDAKRILEIGCGTGALAAAYRRINPTVTWDGYEQNEEAARLAGGHGRLDEVVCEDIETTFMHDQRLWNGTEEAAYDCLVFGDVLEHLPDPWSILCWLAWRVRPGGQILASIPNVQHWTVLQGLLGGEWKYEDEGLFDRSHLRFFTLKSIRAMFADAGLEIFEVRGRPSMAPGDAEGCRRFFDDWIVDGADDNGILRKQSRVYQYLVRALKPPAEVEPLHIHAVLGEPCCARPRILEPFGMLATIPGVTCTTDANCPSRNTPMPDRWGAIPLDRDAILVFQRYRGDSERCVEIARRVLEEKPHCLIIAEWDDAPEAFPELVASDFLPLRAVHAVQVSTEPLAEVIRQWNPEVIVFPNQIANLPPPREPRNGTILFYGAQNRQADWEPIMPALNRVLADHPEVAVCVVHDKAFFDAIERDGKAFYPFCKYQEYLQLLRISDIALLPLDPTQFNRCKSDLKFLECAAEGVAVLASRTVYGETIQFESFVDPQKTGILYTDPLAFECWLRTMIEEPKLRHFLATNAYAYVRDHRLLGQHYRQRHEWYTSLIHRKSELHQALIERVPELARSPVSV